MSVMLRSTNPEAVNEIDPDRDRRVPHIGQMVIYHMRPGEGRAGKMSAPALVTAVEDDDHIEILVIFSADDFMTRWKIPRRTEQNTVNCWSFNEFDDATYQRNSHKPDASREPTGHLTWDDVKEMHAEIGALRNRVTALEGKVIALETKPKRGRPPGLGVAGPDRIVDPNTGRDIGALQAGEASEVEGAEFASELEPREV